MKDSITERDIEAIAKVAIDVMYKYLTVAGYASPEAFINEVGKTRELANLQTLERILIDFLTEAVKEEERLKQIKAQQEPYRP